MINQQIQRLLLTLSNKNNANKKIKINYSFVTWLFLKKLQKEGYVRYCEIDSFSKNQKNFIKVHLAGSLKASNLKITSSTRFKTFLKSSNRKFFEQNLGLIIKSNSRLSNSNGKHFGQIWLTLK